MKKNKTNILFLYVILKTECSKKISNKTPPCSYKKIIKPNT